MAHPAQQDFCERVRGQWGAYFRGKRVLDCGSLDINGSNRPLFLDCVYTGVDVGPGPNVDVVSPIHEVTLPEGTFDTIVSTECFEHDAHYEASLRKIVRLLKPGGLFFFTCASTGREEHGTARCHPGSSPLTVKLGWDHYKNLTEEDIRVALGEPFPFDKYHFEYNPNGGDLYFWGIKA